LSGARLRSLLWLGAALLTALPGILVGLRVHGLTAANLPLGTREGAGGILALVVVCLLLVLMVVGRRLITVEDRLTSSRHIPALRRLALAGAVALVLAGLLAVALSSRGLTGKVSHLWSDFTTTHAISNTNPNRLISAVSANRWVWWKEAAAAFSARPVQGW